MRPGQQQQQKNRMRGRGRKGPNPLSRSYESNGPDVKIRGNAQHIAEKYGMLARDASASGDRVMAENYLQHAEHYNRIVAAAQGQFQPQRDDRDMRDGDEDDDDSQEYRNDERPASNGARDSDRDGYRDRDTNRDRDGNRDGNRDQNRNRDSNRDRDSQRDNRDRDGNRDSRDRDGNRDNNRDRDGNRNRDGNRDRRDRFQPQPVAAQESAGNGQGQPVAREEQAPAPARQVEDARQSDEIVNAVAAPSADDQAPAPRRRGRPRRIREGEETAANEAAPTTQEADVSGETADKRPAAEADAPDSEAPAKRRPGRPRKKKPEEGSGGASDGEGNELPSFLLASNG